MLITNASRLLCGLALFSAFQSPVRASHDYTLHILADSRYFDTSKYYVTIYPPAGYAPNSSCMQTWYTPTNEVRLDSSTTGLTLYIKDKDSSSCGGEPKYNTWNYRIMSIDEDHPRWDQEVGKGSIQFYHFKSGGDWFTSIVPRNADGIPWNNPSIGFATCYNKKVQTNCLNRYTKGKDAADEIYIYFRWPINENYNLF